MQAWLPNTSLIGLCRASLVQQLLLALWPLPSQLPRLRPRKRLRALLRPLASAASVTDRGYRSPSLSRRRAQTPPVFLAHLSARKSSPGAESAADWVERAPPPLLKPATLAGARDGRAGVRARRLPGATRRGARLGLGAGAPITALRPAVMRSSRPHAPNRARTRRAGPAMQGSDPARAQNAGAGARRTEPRPPPCRAAAPGPSPVLGCRLAAA